MSFEKLEPSYYFRQCVQSDIFGDWKTGIVREVTFDRYNKRVYNVVFFNAELNETFDEWVTYVNLRGMPKKIAPVFSCPYCIEYPSGGERRLRKHIRQFHEHYYQQFRNEWRQNRH